MIRWHKANNSNKPKKFEHIYVRYENGSIEPIWWCGTSWPKDEIKITHWIERIFPEFVEEDEAFIQSYTDIESELAPLMRKFKKEPQVLKSVLEDMVGIVSKWIKEQK